MEVDHLTDTEVTAMTAQTSATSPYDRSAFDTIGPTYMVRATNIYFSQAFLTPSIYLLMRGQSADFFHKHLALVFEIC